MSAHDICVYHVDDVSLDSLTDFRVVVRTNSREELRRAIGTLRPAALVLDLDGNDAMDAMVEAREIMGDLAIVGLTGNTDPKLMISALRAGCNQLSTKPLDLNDLTVALRRALNMTSQQSVAGRAVAVIGAVGGAGATTVACYLGVGLAEASRGRSIIIDADLDFGSVARAWDLNPAHTIGDLMTAGTVDAVMLEKAVSELGGGVCLLAGPRTIEQGQGIDETSMSHVIRTAKAAFPYAVVDLPRKLDPITGAVIDSCDKLLIVMQLTVPSIDNARRLIETLTRHDMSLDRIDVVVNRYRKNVHKISVELIERQLGKKVYGVIPNDYRAIASAIDIGQPVASRNPVRTAIAEIAAKLTGQVTGNAAAPVQASGWRSLFGLRRGRTAPEVAAASRAD